MELHRKPTYLYHLRLGRQEEQIRPKEDENEPPPKGREKRGREINLPPNGNADNS